MLAGGWGHTGNVERVHLGLLRPMRDTLARAITKSSERTGVERESGRMSGGYWEDARRTKGGCPAPDGGPGRLF